MKQRSFGKWVCMVAVACVVLAVLLTQAIPAKAITWGEPDVDNIFSNVGAMLVEWPNYGLGQFCSGTLIAPTVFLVAAHCNDYLQIELDAGRLEQSMIHISFSHDNIFEPSTWIGVEAMISHPKYGSGEDGDNVYDVGVVILSETVDLPLAVFPDPGFLNALREGGVLRDGPEIAEFIAVGYGQTIQWPQAVQFDNGPGRWYVESGFHALTQSLLNLFKNNNFDYGGTCYGDSGGPTFYEDADGVLWQVGITSWGDMNCIATGFDYRVDIATTLDFIAPYLP